MDKAAKFNGWRKQFNVRFAPFGCIGKFISIVEYALQPTESGISAQRLALSGGGRSLLDTETKRDANSLNVVAHCLQPVISHTPQRIR